MNDDNNSEAVNKLKDAIRASSPTNGQDPNHVYVSGASRANSISKSVDSKTHRKNEKMKSEFKELVVTNLRLFIDEFIEMPSKGNYA